MVDSKPKSIFISYRRDDSAGYAGRIYDHLRQRFGDEYIFMDVSNINIGADWDQKIREAVSICDVMLAIIGRRWLTASDKYGRRRLDRDDDYVNLEIRTALERNITVIPIVIDNAELPEFDGLPNNLKPILSRQKCEIRHDKFYRDIEDLLDELSKLEVKPPKKSEPVVQVIQVEGISSTVAFGIPTIIQTSPNPTAKTDYIDSFLSREKVNDWQKMFLGDCIRLHRSKPIKSSNRNPGPIPYYGLSGVIDYVDYFDFEGRYLLIDALGSNLIERSKPVAVTVNGKFAVSNSLYVAELKAEFSTVLSLDYLEAMLSIVDFRPYVYGTGQPALRTRELMNIPIAIPALDEQRQIVNLINNQLVELEKMRGLLQEQLHAVDSLESALMRQIFEDIGSNDD